MRANNCWVCSGEGDELCERHERQVEKRAAQFNLPVKSCSLGIGPKADSFERSGLNGK